MSGAAETERPPLGGRTKESESEMSEKCGAVKRGVVDLRCSEDQGHDESTPERPATWHRDVLTNRSEIDHDGAHYVIEHTETVTWEPVDHVAEAMRHFTADREQRKSLPAPDADL